ncbi:MAG: hypothetical protein ACKVQA_23215 [Burkholderiales bacterium]
MRQKADAAREEADAAYNRGDRQAALAHYQRALALDAGSLSDSGKQRVKDLDHQLKKETAAAELERRHRPEVERLRAQAKSIMDQRPADALRMLDAALKLLPEDSYTSGDWWLAKASLGLREGRYNDALEATQNAQNISGDSPEIGRIRAQIADERKRQGSDVQNAFGELRQRIAAGADAGAQLKTVERHSSEARNEASRNKETARDTARKGFDVEGDPSGNLVYPDKNKRQQVPPSALDKQIPQGAKDDHQIKQMQARYRSLDAQKAEKEQKIAEIKEQQKSSKDPLLEVKIATLNNDVGRLAEDQARATKTVKARVEVVKKEMLNKGLVWDESPAPVETQAAQSSESPASESPTLDFIRD